MPSCAETNRLMRELTGVQYNLGEQNKDITSARQARDMKDTAVLATLARGNPFSPDPALRNIMSGVNADNDVNVDCSKATGETISSSMNKKSEAEYTFKRNEQAVTLASTSSDRIESDTVQVDPQLLFQRVVIASNRSEHLEGLFRYELCSYPEALFNTPLTLRPALADTLWAELSSDSMSGPESDVQYVLDGGVLQPRIFWPRGSTTYSEICNLYCSYVHRKYGNAIVVFDGYDEMSTKKKMTQQRRTGGKAGATVTFSESMKVTLKKEVFLPIPDTSNGS